MYYESQFTKIFQSVLIVINGKKIGRLYARNVLYHPKDSVENLNFISESLKKFISKKNRETNR